MIIGISGKKQSGKDTICNIIRALDIWDRRKELNIWTSCKTREEFAREFVWSNTMFLANSKWEKHALADKLKQMASILLEVPVEKWEDAEFKNTPNDLYLHIDDRTTFTNREVLQIIGNTLRENLDPHVWVNALFREYSSRMVAVQSPYWIIPDVRMINEAESIKDFEGILIRVNKECSEIDTHISEIELDNYTKFDYVVENNGTIEELITKITKIYDMCRTIGVSPNNE